MKNKIVARLDKSETYRDFKRLFTFKRNVDEFEKPVGLTFADNSFLRYISFAVLYFAQGIPNGLLHFAIPAWMATVDYSALDIGKYLAIVTLPWSLKLIAAPIMDRFTFLPMGRRRPWLLVGQFGIVMGLIALSTIQDPDQNLLFLMSVGFAINLFTIFQDIATDGLAIDVLPIHQQARANGLMWGSKTIGTSVIVAITIILIQSIGFGSTVLLFAGMVSLIMVFPLLVKERPNEKRLPWTKGKTAEEVLNLQLPSWRLLLTKLFKSFFLPISLLMGLAAFSNSITQGFIDAALPVFTVQELGWSDNQFPQMLATAKLVGGVMGMFVGGALIDLVGKIKITMWLIAFKIVAFAALALSGSYWGNAITINAFILGYQVLDVFTTIVLFAIAMQLCWKQVAATQFTLYMTISNLGMSFGSYVFGYSEQFFTWEYLFLINVVLLAFMFIVVRFINFDKHDEQMAKKLGKQPVLVSA